MEKSKQQKNKVRFVVVREFSGEKSMREAFEPVSYTHLDVYKRQALFLIMSDTDDSFNFLISMCYTQLFNLLSKSCNNGRLLYIRCFIVLCLFCALVQSIKNRL